MPPHSCIYPHRTTGYGRCTYKKHCQQGYIRPSPSPVSVVFFFMEKKGGGLRPCIHHQGLNQCTVRYCYPLPLVPAAIEQLRSAKVFTKLDLRSAYNLVSIGDGDEWKTAFSTTAGNYEYLVMLYGLSHTPSVFQCLINGCGSVLWRN